MKAIFFPIRYFLIILICGIMLISCSNLTNSPQTNKMSNQSVEQHSVTPKPSIEAEASITSDPTLGLVSSHTPSPTTSPLASEEVLPGITELKRPKVKGIYVSAWSTVGSKFQRLLDLVDQTDLNAMVIDVKSDSGQVTYASKLPRVNEIGANSNKVIPDLKEKLQLLKDKHIYTIARIVVFKDPYLAGIDYKSAMHTQSGAIWKDNKGVSWVDPFKEEVWDYNIQIAKEAAELGFDEIQFDYVRFPENGKKIDKEVSFDNPNHWSKAQAIQNFLQKAKQQMGDLAYVSADVFGLTTSSKDDMGIGQDWSLISQGVDIISPMVYPSHYSSGVYGVKAPDLQPYAVVKQAMKDARVKNQALPHSAAIRPWFQDFTATWVKPHKKYSASDVNEQVKAAKEEGVEEFLLWNSSSTYSYK